MRPDDIRELTNEEIQSELEHAHEELFNLRFQESIGQLKNTNRKKDVKKDIARMKTILRERELWEMWEGERE